ncbi:hypothetical protein K6T82_22460 [Flavobacterium sp. 17A]|uniref:Uncharacterized protein n=1 Tax=Flavobacterium potami TaxID=2872310 RepID=A0A9X1HE91_9FLAO|nr:hypothetical protein [Flavobacterium potami]MBZ4037541.1 hypothetical protein [Flavobacterium potami]
MKKKIYLLLLLVINLISAQEKENDYFIFYKGGEKYLKPIKYVLYNKSEGNIKREKEGKVFFNIASERFVFDQGKHKMDTCSLHFLNEIKIENAIALRDNEVTFYKNKVKKTKSYKKTGFINPFPISNVHPYFKIYILEKTDKEVIKYESDWEYSDF